MKNQTFYLPQLLITCCLFFLFLGGKASAEDFDVAAKHAIAIEVSTGKILYEKDAKTPAAIASITKLMTAYMVYDEIAKGHLTWETEVDISDYAFQLTANYEVSNVPMDARRYTVKELVDASLIASSNSASIALAEHISGSEPAFVDAMMKKLKTWGITDAKLVNASGLNNSYLGTNIYPGSGPEDENTMSAQSVAILSSHLIKDFPKVLDITSLTRQNFAGTPMNTYNQFLEGQPFYRKGVTGLKTGTSDLAGVSLVTSATENKMQTITVILNADKGKEDPTSRFVETNRVLDYISSTYQLTTLVAKGESYEKSRALVKDGQKTTVIAVAEEDLKVISRKDNQDSSALIKTNDLVAPVESDTLVGTLTYDDQNLVGDGYLDNSPRIKLLASAPVKRSNFLKVFWNHFVDYVNTKL